MPGELPNFTCSHVPMEIFLFYKMGKKWGNKKESCLCNGRFPYECVLLRFGDTLGLMPLGAPPSREHTRMGTSATTLFLMNLFHLCHKGPCTFSCLFSCSWTEIPWIWMKVEWPWFRIGGLTCIVYIPCVLGMHGIGHG
jgi:hypothetical protein